MKKIPGWLIIVIIFGALIAVKYMFFAKKEDKTAANKGKDAPPVAVNYYVAQPFEMTNKVYTTGKIGALNEISIIPEISGKVTAIYFKEGEAVSKGAPLIKINDADLQAQLLKNKTQLKLSEEKNERLKKLLAIKGISQEEADAQENEVASLKADQAYILAQLAKTTITAPFNGVVGLKNISEGSYISPAQTVASLVQVKPVFVEFSVPERYSAILKKGMDIRFSYDNNADDKDFTAQVYALEPKIDDATKTLRGRAMYSGSESFYPGSFVKVFVDLGKPGKSLMIPTQSVIPILKGQKVIVYRNGKAEDARIVTGIRTDDKIQVLEGLHEGDTVLTTGLLSVKKDSKLKLIKAGN
ncbi:MAG: efflux RND transporter periplasmic adaptor subunit [Bacteroidetes bacterium]|nr:efflux RND transporter periplasmic adaptor subunit [Bacteroidota bacterium]